MQAPSRRIYQSFEPSTDREPDAQAPVQQMTPPRSKAGGPGTL